MRWGLESWARVDGAARQPERASLLAERRTSDALSEADGGRGRSRIMNLRHKETK